ncbi:hypothetical protein ACNQFZ_16960 [Schinkia sp. CFF1]
MFFQQNYEERNGTAFFSMGNRTLYHEYEGTYFLFNGLLDGKGISQYTTWQKNNLENKQVVNIENGILPYNPISAGQIESAFSLETTLLPYEIKHGYYWAVLGKDLNKINRKNEFVKNNPERLIRELIENDFSNDKIIPLSN